MQAALGGPAERTSRVPVRGQSRLNTERSVTQRRGCRIVDRMEIIDAQIGVWDASSDEFPWEDASFGQGATGGVEARIRAHQTHETNTVERALMHMDELGVDAAILSLPMFYGYNPAYAVAAAERHPGRFASSPRLDNRAADLAARMRDLRARPGVVGIRVVFLTDAEANELRMGGYDDLWGEAERQQLPVFVFCPSLFAEIAEVARQHPGLQLIVDHFGLPQPPLMDADPEPFQALPQLLALAELPNVAVKFSGAPTLSSEPFPFADLWPHLRRVVDAFGPERLIWASDYQRVKGHTYAEALGFVRHTDELTDMEKEWILGKAARRVLRWERSDA